MKLAVQTHPPIPPNCPYFGGAASSKPRDETRAWFFTLPDRHFVVLGGKIDNRYRPIIAAVAEVAWRIEADTQKRLQNDTFEANCETDNFGKHLGAKHPQYRAMVAALRAGNAAVSNASAWRTWGECK